MEIQKAGGGVQTGLAPAFFGGDVRLEIGSEKRSINYSCKRDDIAMRKGVDIPRPVGTPIRAVTDGSGVGSFVNQGNRKEVELIRRHTPRQTGLPYWVCSRYAHRMEASNLPVGARVNKTGQENYKTHSAGEMGRRVQRGALHFAALLQR